MKSRNFALFQVAAVLAGNTALGSGTAETSVVSTPPQLALALPGPSCDSGDLTLPVPSTIWEDDVGNGFRKGATEVDLSVGASLGSKIFGSTDAHDLGLMKLSVGRVISDVVASDRWYGGNWELMGEVFGGEQFKPENAHLAGLTALLRYDFSTGTKWVPFFDAGGGVTETDIGSPDLGGTGQFNLQTGPGVHWFICKNIALTAQYRFLHLSCASMQHPNHGVNTSVFYSGISWFF
jgi:opacity protein-like surface antigen